jgi:hypothetical protein
MNDIITTTSPKLNWRTLPAAAKTALISVALGFLIRFRTVTVQNGDCSESEPTAVVFGGIAVVAGLVTIGEGVRRRSTATIGIGLVTVLAGVFLVLRGVGTIATACR